MLSIYVFYNLYAICMDFLLCFLYVYTTIPMLYVWIFIMLSLCVYYNPYAICRDFLSCFLYVYTTISMLYASLAIGSNGELRRKRRLAYSCFRAEARQS